MPLFLSKITHFFLIMNECMCKYFFVLLSLRDQWVSNVWVSLNVHTNSICMPTVLQIQIILLINSLLLEYNFGISIFKLFLYLCICLYVYIYMCYMFCMCVNCSIPCVSKYVDLTRLSRGKQNIFLFIFNITITC